MFHKRHPEAGARPGTLLIGSDAVATRVRMVTYAPDQAEYETVEDVTSLRSRLDPGQVTWIDVQGFADEAILQSLAEQFEIHPLAMEDVVNIPQSPKSEPYAQHLLVIVRLAPDPDDLSRVAQLSMLVGRNYVITFQNHYTDRFAP